MLKDIDIVSKKKKENGSRREKKDYVRMSTRRIIVQKKSGAFYERYSQINYSSHASKITSTSMKLPLEFHRTNGIPEH